MLNTSISYFQAFHRLLKHALVKVTGPNSKIAAEATQTGGRAGGVNINAAELQVQNLGEVSVTNINDQTDPNLPGNERNITLTNLNNLEVSGGGKITASTATGRAGNVNINVNEAAAASVTVSGSGSRIAVEATGTGGKAGGGEINARQVKVQGQGAEISASTDGDPGETSGITVKANTFELLTGGKVRTTTSGKGKAGDIKLYVQDSITLAGAGSGLFADTETGSTGDGGNIFIDPQTVIIEDGATASVDSQGEGTAGNIQIQASSLTLDNGTISAETRKSLAKEEGANITLEISDLLIMKNESRISAQAFEKANGGNIDIDAKFIVAFPPTGPNGSDIVANADEGRGGNIAITTRGLFGLREQKAMEGNRTNDIDASSKLGISGEVEINDPDVDPRRGLEKLPSEVIDATKQVAQDVCQPTDQWH